MQVFICWSGDRSRSLAHIMEKRLPQIIDGVKPFVSTSITKGGLWFSEVSEQLRSAAAGLICLTRENLGSPWIHYEAGVLARAVSEQRDPAGRIFTYLLGVDPTEVQGPLAAYQSTVATRDDTRLLIQAIADRSGSKSWEERFEVTWPKIEDDLKSIKGLMIREVFEDLEDLFRRKTFEEPLSSCTAQTWCRRFAGALETKLELQRKKRTVESACRPFSVFLYDRLIGELDGYEMDMGSLLLEERRFKMSDQGYLAIEPEGIEVACERRRLRIKKLVSELVDPRRAPVLDQAGLFAFLETFEEKKNLIHNIEAQIPELAKHKTLASAGDSDWDLDRIAWYLLQDWLISEKRTSISIGHAVDSTRIELEKIGARATETQSLIPLHYSLAPVQAWMGRYAGEPPKDTSLSEILRDVEALLERIEAMLERNDLDRGGQLRQTLLELRQRLEALRDRREESIGAGGGSQV